MMGKMYIASTTHECYIYIAIIQKLQPVYSYEYYVIVNFVNFGTGQHENSIETFKGTWPDNFGK